MKPAVNLRPLWWFATALALVWVATLGWRPLFNPDEGRYADIPLEMLQTHDFIVPHLNGVVYLEKPPLQYWITALGYRLFPINEWSARMVLALGFLGIQWLVFRLARTLSGERAATVAVFMSASGLLMQLMATLLTLDLSLTFWFTLACVSLCEAQLKRDTDAKRTALWMMVCYAAMAMATLTKGLIGLALPGLSLLVYSALTRDGALWRHLHLVKGLVLYAAIVAPWFGLVEQHHPGALQFLIIHEHFQRYLTTVHERYHPAWYFLALLLPSLLPFSLSGGRALWRRQLLTKTTRFDAERLLWSLAVVTLVFFSLSDSKLPPYILPMMPLLAVLASRHTEAQWRLDLKLNSAVVAVLGALMVIASLQGVNLEPNASLAALDHAKMASTLQPWLGGFGLWLVAIGLVTFRLSTPRPLIAATTLASGFLITGIGLFHGVASDLSYRYSAKPLLATQHAIPASEPIYTVHTFDCTLPFYLRHSAIPVGWRGELDYGLNFEPQKGRERLSEFTEEWKNLDQGYALLPRDVHNQLQQSGLPMTVQAYDFDNVWVSRR